MLTREQLYEDLHKAYLDARRHKRNRPYQLRFEAHLEENLESLCDVLWNRTYQPLPSDCFIITDPKRREVFAAHFRDRIVHHLYFNYTHEMFERTFIEDSYSCIKGRGTHYGIYISRATLERMDAKLYALESENDRNHICNALNSYCGVLSHWNNFNVRQMMLLKRHQFTRWGMFDYGLRHYYDLSRLERQNESK